MKQAATLPLVLTSEFSDLSVEIDPADGTLLALSTPGERLALTTRVVLTTAGTEVRAAAGGLDYHDTVDVTPARDGIGEARERVALDSRTWSIAARTTQSSDWSLVWHYQFRAQSPRLAVSLEVICLRDGAILRNATVEMQPCVGELAGWRIQAPGNKLRADLDLDQLSYASTVQTPAGVEGSTGLVALERVAEPATFFFWPLAKSTYGEIVLSPAPEGVSISWQTDIAGVLKSDASLEAGPLLLDFVRRPFASVLGDVPDMLADAGISSPAAPPTWGADVNLYEVQIGFGVFRGGYQYAPYPTAEDLLGDLDRIRSLGYNALQIMPQQPYPSYNVHDFDDINISWGNEEVLREIVDGCHERGMRIIFDILLHGVVDGEAMDAAIAAIDAGPYIDRLDEVTPDVTTLERDEMHYYLVAWSRHVKDFEPYWRGGSPRRHALVDEHPEWFTRDSAGAVTGIYTQAFDLAHPGWQRYFIDKAVSIMERMGIDGYRFDAPSYNYFMNWSERTRSDASVSMLGCLSLFRQLRKEMRSANPDCLLYTEPSGALYRVDMDVAYNYDEQWLVRAVMEKGAGKAHWIRNARELGQWFAQRDASLPAGSLTAHHLDSHDSFWWPEPGQKWRREQYGVPATAALMAVFALSGGPYMTFVGGEVGIEDEVRAVNALRTSHPVLARGRSDHTGVRADDDDVYAVIRTSEEGHVLVLVNLSDRTVTTSVSVRGLLAGAAVDDLLGGEPARWSSAVEGSVASLVLGPYKSAAYDLEVAR